MTQSLIYSITSCALFIIGFYGITVCRHILHKVLSLNIMGVGIFLLLIVCSNTGLGLIDPVPQAMVLTGIVVAVAGTALALNFICRIHAILKAEFEANNSTDNNTDNNSENDSKMNTAVQDNHKA